MEIVGIFDNCGVGLDVKPCLKQVVIEENDKYGIMYENANNDKVRLDFNLRNASNEDEVITCVNAYLYNKKSINDEFLGLENLPEELKDNHDRYVPIFFDKDSLSEQRSFTKLDNESFIVEEGLELSGYVLALGLVTDGGKIFIGSAEYLLGIVDAIYSDRQSESVLKIKANLFEIMNDLEEAVKMNEIILETQNLAYPLVEMYQHELKSLNNKIRGREILDKKIK